jgi:hypothetical protein
MFRAVFAFLLLLPAAAFARQNTQDLADGLVAAVSPLRV